jgi:antitoxin component YwqK of YwqJK toxin-antitoxin module
MRSILIYSSLVFLLFAPSCGTGEERSAHEKQNSDSITDARNEQTKKDTVPPANGIFEMKHPNGQVSVRGEMRNGKREGTWFSYYENGQPMSQAEYVNGVRNGKSITWYPNGQKRFEGTYTSDRQAGVWKYWEESGQLAKEIDYDKPTAK